MSKCSHAPWHVSQQSSLKGGYVMGGYPGIHGFGAFTLLFQGEGLEVGE